MFVFWLTKKILKNLFRDDLYNVCGLRQQIVDRSLVLGDLILLSEHYMVLFRISCLASWNLERPLTCDVS